MNLKKNFRYDSKLGIPIRTSPSIETSANIGATRSVRQTNDAFYLIECLMTVSCTYTLLMCCMKLYTSNRTA